MGIMARHKGAALWLFIVAIVAALAFAGVGGNGAYLAAPSAGASSYWPLTATLISPEGAGKSYRFRQRGDNGTIEYEISYNGGVAWHESGNLGGSLQANEAVGALYLDGYVYVFITNRNTGYQYFKRTQPDAGIAFTAYWQPVQLR